MSSLFNKLKEQATTSLQTLAKNIKENQQTSLLLGAPVNNQSSPMGEGEDAAASHENHSPSQAPSSSSSQSSGLVGIMKSGVSNFAKKVP